MSKEKTQRVKDALSNISYSKLLSWYECRDFVEVVVDRWGDVSTYRIYDNGEVYEV
jgi:hypothetical protein